MSWSSWGAKLNVQSIVSQGLEQVSKLKEDVEKQFDQVVAASSTAQPPGSNSSRSTGNAIATAGDTTGSTTAMAVEPPSAAVNAALFGDFNSSTVVAPPPPPHSLDGKSSSAALLASLGLPTPTGRGGGTLTVDTPSSSAPPSSTSKRENSKPQSAVDFFGSFLPTEPATDTRAAFVTTAATPPTSGRGTASLSQVPRVQATPMDHGEEDKEEKAHVNSSAAVVAGDCGVAPATVDVSSDALEQVAPEDGDVATEENDTSAAIEILMEKEIAEVVNADHHEPVDDQDPDQDTEVEKKESEELQLSIEEKEVVHSDETSGVDDVVAEEAGNTHVEAGDDDNDAYEQALEDDDGEDQEEEADENDQASVSEVVSPTVSEPAVDAVAVEAEAEAAGLSSDQEEIVSLKRQLTQRETQLMSTSTVIQELHDELDKTCQREVAAVERNRFLTEQLELLRQEVLRLNRVVAQQQQQQQQQQQPSREQELLALQQAVTDKDTKMQALLDEGQTLSVKQSQLEQRLRQLRREKNEEEEQKLKLQAQSDTLAIQVQDLTLKHKAVDDENKKLLTELKNAQQTAEQATNQFMTTEQELSQERETVEQLQEELTKLTEANELLRGELDSLQHTSASHATLSEEKSEMETTIQYLQQSVHDLEADAARREDMARMEIADLKRKWKDALQRVDALGLSVSEATQPLLRQIHALQEDQRARQETWKATEATLLQRIHDASAQRKEFEAQKLELEQQLHDVKSHVDDLQLEGQRRQVEIQREKDRVEAVQQKEREARSQFDALQIELDELKLKLQDEQHAKQTLLAARLVSSSSSNDSGAAQQSIAETATFVAEMQQLRQSESKLRHDLEWHQKELQRVKAATMSPRMAMQQQRRSFDEDWAGNSATNSPRVLSASSSFSSLSSQSQSQSQASILQRTLESSVDDSRLGSTSVLGMSQLQQRLRLREGENRLLRQQLQAIDDKQKQTTDEIVRLSTRNALLESSATQFEETQVALEELKQKQHVLLELFGEKEEQVEELQAEVKELKAFYRKQLDTLARHQQQ